MKLSEKFKTAIPNTPIGRKKQIVYFIAIFCLVLAGSAIPSRIAYTLTASNKHRLYFIDSASEVNQLKKNGYAVFMMSTSFVNNGNPVKIIKQVACLPGDTLKVADKEYYCNDVFIGKAKDTSITGVKVNNFIYNGKVPANTFFAIGQHRDSYDSRYHGFIEGKDVKAIAYPIF